MAQTGNGFNMTDAALPATTGVRVVRIFAWMMVATTFVYLIDNWLKYWLDWPGSLSVLNGEFSVLGLIQVLLYVAAFALVVLYPPFFHVMLHQVEEDPSFLGLLAHYLFSNYPIQEFARRTRKIPD